MKQWYEFFDQAEERRAAEYVAKHKGGPNTDGREEVEEMGGEGGWIEGRLGSCEGKELEK